MTEEKTFRKTNPVAVPADAPEHSDIDFAMLEPRDQLKSLLQAEMADKPFSELSSVLFDHRGASIVGHILLDALEESGYSVDDFDAVGALTAAAVPLVSAMIQAAASRGENLNGFVMDFVYPSLRDRRSRVSAWCCWIPGCLKSRMYRRPLWLPCAMAMS